MFLYDFVKIFEATYVVKEISLSDILQLPFKLYALPTFIKSILFQYILY